MKQRFGFTLAEVLITIAIIATIIAMTIPTLLENSTKSEFRTSFRHMLNSTNQAIKMNIAMNYVDFSNTTTTDSNPTSSILGILKERMHVVKVVEGNSDSAVMRMFGNYAKDNYTVFFADGVVLTFPKSSKNCTINKDLGGAICTGIVDVNGVRPPNRLSNCYGKDVKNAFDDLAGPCSADNVAIYDQFAILMADQLIQPNGQCAKYVLFEN